MLFTFSSRALRAQTFQFDDTPLLEAIEQIESATPYSFLYRESLIANVRVSFTSSSEDLVDSLRAELDQNQIGLSYQEASNHILLFRKKTVSRSSSVYVSGFVVDAQSGERLPYSTLSWREEGILKGISSTKTGQYTLQTETKQATLAITVSYIGYTSQVITLNIQEQPEWNEVTIRLEPELFTGNEVIINGVNYYSVADTHLTKLVDLGVFNPLGETNTLRSLQQLPAVSTSTALSEGINIRGSAADGFRVLLDGQTMYNQSHLFGLLDVMNSDVLRTSGFYYDVTPAQFDAPLGGTLALVTASGSLNELKGNAGLSNSSGKITLEGPLKKGKASWLVSGRHSLIDQLNWFNNQELVDFGLDVGRPLQLDESTVTLVVGQDNVGLDEIDVVDVRSSFIDPVSSSANFYDVHGKVHWETNTGGVLTVSSHFASDNAAQQYNRVVEIDDRGTARREDDLEISQLFDTENEWNSEHVVAHAGFMLSRSTYSNSHIGFSNYFSNFLKGDFPFTVPRDPAEPDGRRITVLDELYLENSVRDFSVKQEFLHSFPGLNIAQGISYTDYDVRYIDRGVERPSFQSRRTSQLVDLYQQFDFSNLDGVRVQVGHRLHYFSNGRYTRWSPRARFQLFPNAPVSFGLGYSQNYQFLHQLQFFNINSTDFWILTNEDQPPSSVQYYSSGIYVRPLPFLYLHMEGYLKNFNNLRIHELNTANISSTFQNDQVPWFFNNTGVGRGLEWVATTTFNRGKLSATYALSSMELENARINDGDPFAADWDRLHQFTASAEFRIIKHLNTYASWTLASGTPDRVTSFERGDDLRHSTYSRIDLSARYIMYTQKQRVELTLSVYNLLNRDNEWYSERLNLIVEQQINNRFETVVPRVASGNAQVFDLGIQPSVGLVVYF